jgi:hypothetical protein
LLASTASDEAAKEYVEALIDGALHGVAIHVQNRVDGEASSRSPNP